MPIDILASARSTALIGLVAASFSTPVVLTSDAFDQATAKLRGEKAAHSEPAEPPQVLIAGGIQFDMAADWGKLGASVADAGADAEHEDAKRIGSIVTAICPAGSSGGDCKGDARVTILTYSGEKGHQLPLLTEFEAQLDSRFAAEYSAFVKSEDTSMRPAADGTRFLDYSFTWSNHGTDQSQRLAAYRHEDGSGVVLLATGGKVDDHAEAIDELLASAREPLESAE